jgi:hypothetical protein
MKLISRIVMSTAMLVTGFTALAGMSHAETLTATTSIETANIGTPSGDLSYSGLRTTLDGGFTNGVEYEASIRSGDVEGFAYRSFDAELAYLHNGIVGPKVSYGYAELGDTSFDQTRVGLTGRHQISPDVIIYGDLMTNADAFADDAAVKLGAAYDVSHDLTVWGEVGRDSLGVAREDRAELGMLYHINDHVAFDGRVQAGDQDGADGIDISGASAGLAFRF